jgi:chromosome segregation ATPase
MDGQLLIGNWAALGTLGASVLAGVFALLKWFAGRLLSDIEQRLCRIDELERRFERLLAELPLNYQRREDTARELAAADERYQRTVERLITTLRDDLNDSRARIAALEKDRDEAARRYQMRDDAVREFTAINVKIDRIYELLARRSHD